MPELLPVWRLRCGRWRSHPGPEQRPVQDQLPRLFPGLSGSGHHVPKIQVGADQR